MTAAFRKRGASVRNDTSPTSIATTINGAENLNRLCKNSFQNTENPASIAKQSRQQNPSKL